MRARRSCALVMAALCMAIGCGTSSAGGAPEAFTIRGSNTIGARLVPALIEAFAASIGAKAVTMVGSQPEEVDIKLETGTGSVLAEIGVHSHGSGTAVPGLISGTAQFGMLSRPIDDKEMQALSAAGIPDLRATQNELVLALDGVLVLVAPGNPLRALTLTQLSGIFSGAITDWSAVGREAGRIQVYARDGKSGTFDTFNALVLKSYGVALTPDARRFESSEELSDSVARDPNGIGFVGFAYLRNAKALGIGNDCGLAYAPTTFNVKIEQYPLSRRLFLYSHNVPSGSLAERFFTFAGSPEAQDIVRAEGFVDQSIELLDDRDHIARLADGVIALDADVHPATLKELASDLKNSARMSATLQFRLASARLDSKAATDVERIAGFIRSLAETQPGRTVVLAGFTDSVGDFAANKVLSQARAEQAKGDLMRAFGSDVPRTPVVVRGYSKLLPTSCNTTAEGRNRNRRVEIWLK